MKFFVAHCFLVLSLILFSCSGDVIPENPLNELKKEFKNKSKYSILLQDMDLRGNEFFHKYKFIDFQKDSVIITESKWYKVHEDFFRLHEDDLGMEVFSKMEDGKINSLVSPPGFTHIINDTTYGFWQKGKPQIDTFELEIDSSLWVFKPNYFYVQNGLGLKGLPVWRFDFQNFALNSFLVKPYYGSTNYSDSTYYGSRSSYVRLMRPGFFSRKMSKGDFQGSSPGGSGRLGSRGGGGFGK
jgi:hypothetical protein